VTTHWTDDAASPAFTTVIRATGPGANVLAILGAATSMLRQLDVPRDRIDKLRADVMNAGSYRAAVEAIERWFPVDRGDER